MRDERIGAVKQRLIRYLRLAAICYLLLVALLAVFQRQLIYLAERTGEPEQLARASALNVEAWRSANQEIIGWRRPPRAGAPASNRLVVFHGNAGSALYRTHFIDGFEALENGRLWQVHIFEYPGYGARPGEPSEPTITLAARDALLQLGREDSRPIYLLGESLGSGAACALARDEPQHVAGICLLTPFARLADVAAHHYPLLMVRLILRDRWDNVLALRNYRGPTAVILAEDDEIIPLQYGDELFASYPGPKRRWLQSRATHNTIDFRTTSPWWAEVSEFLLQKHL